MYPNKKIRVISRLFFFAPENLAAAAYWPRRYFTVKHLPGVFAHLKLSKYLRHIQFQQFEKPGQVYPLNPLWQSRQANKIQNSSNEILNPH